VASSSSEPGVRKPIVYIFPACCARAASGHAAAAPPSAARNFRRCGLPCDPPVGGHSCNGAMIPRDGGMLPRPSRASATATCSMSALSHFADSSRTCPEVRVPEVTSLLTSLFPSARCENGRLGLRGVKARNLSLPTAALRPYTSRRKLQIDQGRRTRLLQKLA
jgi:hypothetical protein